MHISLSLCTLIVLLAALTSASRDVRPALLNRLATASASLSSTRTMRFGTASASAWHSGYPTGSPYHMGGGWNDTKPFKVGPQPFARPPIPTGTGSPWAPFANSSSFVSQSYPTAFPSSLPGLSDPKQRNIVCQNITLLKDGKDQWELFNGTDMLDTFEQFLTQNLILCEDCWGQDHGQCAHLDNPECKHGLRDLATPGNETKPRYDRAAWIFADYADSTDILCEVPNDSCTSDPVCIECDRPGMFAIIKSLTVLKNSLHNIWLAIDESDSIIGDQATHFQQVFAPVPSAKDDAMFLAVLVGVVGGVVGFLPGIGGAMSGLGIGVGSGVGLTEFFFSTPSPPDTATWLGLLVNKTKGVFEEYGNQLLATGNFTAPSADTSHNKTSAFVSASSLMQDGKLMKRSDEERDQYANIRQAFQIILFQQLAVYTWSHLEVKENQKIPFIAFDNKPCDQVDPKDKNGLESIINGLSKLDVSVTYEGKCYYLLGAKTEDNWSISGSNTECVAKALDGGTNKVLSDNADKFASLSLNDFIVPSVKGWMANKNLNGYPTKTDNGQFPRDPQDAASISLPVCDFLGDRTKPGVGCPVVAGALTDQNECSVRPASDGKNDPGEFSSGTCRAHVSQWLRHHSDDNRLDTFQLSVTVYDQDNRAIGEAVKQPAPEPLLVVDSELPFQLAVVGGKADDDPVEFWYGDQYWNSKDDKCHVGRYDGSSGNRDMDCSFPCPIPDKGATPPVTATSAHPFPGPVTAAVGGPDTFSNLYISSSASATAPPPDPTPTYATGECSLHIRQFQKNEKGENETPDYQLELTLYDAKGALLSDSGQLPAPGGQPVQVHGMVPQLTVTTKKFDKDPLTLTLNGVAFDSSVTDKNSKSGYCSKLAAEEGYEDGHRDMDCHFAC